MRMIASSWLRRKRVWLGLGVAAALTSSVLITGATRSESPSASLGTGVTGGVDARPVNVIGATFFFSGFNLSLSSGQHVTMAEFANGTGDTFVDDVIVIRVKHQNGSVSTFTHDYSNGCGFATSLPPIDVTPYFNIGSNNITVTLKDKCGGTMASSPVFLTRF
jgi:hypothetical protein